MWGCAVRGAGQDKQVRAHKREGSTDAWEWARAFISQRSQSTYKNISNSFPLISLSNTSSRCEDRLGRMLMTHCKRVYFWLLARFNNFWIIVCFCNKNRLRIDILENIAPCWWQFKETGRIIQRFYTHRQKMFLQGNLVVGGQPQELCPAHPPWSSASPEKSKPSLDETAGSSVCFFLKTNTCYLLMGLEGIRDYNSHIL